MAEKLVDLKMHLHRQTDRAVQVSMDGDPDEACWLPKSQIEFYVTPATQHSGIVEVTLPEWLAIERGLV